jgi:hypothetical protein
LSLSLPLTPLLLLIPSRLDLILRHGQRRIIRHGHQILLLGHLSALLDHAAQQLEVVDVERGRVRVEELGFLVKRVRECVRGADGHGDEVAEFGVDVGFAGDVVADRALCY